jgi:hypothetical protein
MIASSSRSPSSNNSLMRLADTIHGCSCGGKNFQLCQVSEIFFLILFFLSNAMVLLITLLL